MRLRDHKNKSYAFGLQKEKFEGLPMGDLTGKLLEPKNVRNAKNLMDNGCCGKIEEKVF
jgi:hypothetical protein